MIRSWLSWRNGFSLLVLLIVAGSVLYSRLLSRQLEQSEKEKVRIWAQAQRTASATTNPDELGLAILISTSNTDIPIIETTDTDSITGNYLNIDSSKIARDTGYLRKKLLAFKKEHPPIVVRLSNAPENRYYYGKSSLETQLRYFPIVQLLVLILFFAIFILLQRIRYRNTQNLLWVGMAKETAHQLGTPLSSLEGWVEILKDTPQNRKVTAEMEKDIQRLLLITDRFGKIGSAPKLEPYNIVPQVEEMVTYIKRRASDKIQIHVKADAAIINAMISPPLFDWVIENLLKNALDAMRGKGYITIHIWQADNLAGIDVTDSGKGISHSMQKKVFDPGFTTKKRGWGLGLALSRRIIEDYHHGSISVKWSEQGKGTTFRIVLRNKQNEAGITKAG